MKSFMISILLLKANSYLSSIGFSNERENLFLIIFSEYYTF